MGTSFHGTTLHGGFNEMLTRILLTVLFTAIPVLADNATTVQTTRPDANNFSIMHITDLHVSPHLYGQAPVTTVRGQDTITWLCAESHKTQNVESYGITASPPSCVFATGDITEYGVIDDTWNVFKKALSGIKVPIYVTPGNHDNTWVAMYHIMRSEYGGQDYSFDLNGIHFVFISSASPQEPTPSIDAKTRIWLKKDLDSIKPGMPIILSLHHPLEGSEFASPAEHDTLIDLLKNYNVALILYGHGHSIVHKNLEGIDAVMGGSTFGKNSGYGLLSVQNGTLRYAYRFFKPRSDKKDADKKKTWKSVLEKQLAGKRPQRLFKIAFPTKDKTFKDRHLGVDLEFNLPLTSTEAEKAGIEIRVDGKKVEFKPVPSDSSNDKYHHALSFAAADATPGAHLLTVKATLPDGQNDIRTATFHIAAPNPEALAWTKNLPASVKAGPAVTADALIVAGTDGTVRALDKDTGKEKWVFATGGEIIATPAVNKERIIFPSGDGKVYAIDHNGSKIWSFDAHTPVYGIPLIHNQTVYVGDNSGRLHALDILTGKSRWTFERADFTIESKPYFWKNMIVFGAWDGYVYAVNATDGKLAWKTLGPKSSEKKALRYYAPADCGFVAIKDHLFVCDRGYWLGIYTPDGKMVSKQDEKVAAIAFDSTCDYILGRTTDNRLCKFDESGTKIWDIKIPAGRFPIPPTSTKNHVYICSNRGRLNILSPEDGKSMFEYQATPGFYVMAPVCVDKNHCYIAGMDGSITALNVISD